MRLLTSSVLTLSFGLIACSQAESEAQAPEPVAATSEKKTQVEALAAAKSSTAKLAAESTQMEKHINCEGVLKQGGAVLCHTYPNSHITVGGIKTKSDADGYFIVGFDRDAPKQEKITLSSDRFGEVTETLEITQREYSVQSIDGLPPSQVSTFTEKQLAHIRASTARKKVGLTSRSDEMGLRDGFTMAVTGIKSSDFGNQRILNGVPKRPHYGVDIAAPEGTPIFAPADGVVSLADDDLYFEGAMVFIDHGQGLISMYLHMSDIDVEVGQKVKRGDQIGAVGARGRATGPHLCWRMKWRNRYLDPELLTQWPHD